MLASQVGKVEQEIKGFKDAISQIQIKIDKKRQGLEALSLEKENRESNCMAKQTEIKQEESKYAAQRAQVALIRREIQR